MFNTTKFIYDGESCESYGLLIYSFDSNGGVKTGDIGAKVEMVEDRTLRNIKPVVYGSKQETSHKFQITFGSLLPINRSFFSEIVYWLSGRSQYRTLEILQDDMAEIRYKCYMTDIEQSSIDGIPYAFTATVVCDIAYAYSYPFIYTYNISGSLETIIYNDSAKDGYIFPKVTLTPSNVTQVVSIINQNDSNREFKFSDLNNYDNETIHIDNETQVITSDNGVNMYPYFNRVFFRLVRGINTLTISGDGTVIIEFELFRVAGS